MKSPTFPLLLIGIVFLAGCTVTAPEVGPEKDKVQREIDATGKLGGGDGLLNELIRGRRSGVGTGIGVNAYLWQASLDTLSFMPLSNADSFGGVITTDWHTVASEADSRYKLNVFIIGRELRAGALRVAVFKQKHVSGKWLDVAENASVNKQIENAILTKARQLRIDSATLIE